MSRLSAFRRFQLRRAMRAMEGRLEASQFLGALYEDDGQLASAHGICSNLADGLSYAEREGA